MMTFGARKTTFFDGNPPPEGGEQLASTEHANKVAINVLPHPVPVSDRQLNDDNANEKC